jgi:hypothetical protein
MEQGETGIDEVIHEALNVFPNPVQSNQQIYFSKLLNCDLLEIKDLTGKKVFLDETNWTNQSYHLPDLISGTYHVRILADSEQYIFRLNVFGAY